MAVMCHLRREPGGGYSPGAAIRPPTCLTAPAAGGPRAGTVLEPQRTRTHTLTPPLCQLLYAPIYQAPRLSPADMPAARRPLGAR